METSITQKEFKEIWNRCVAIHESIENPAPQSITYPQNGTSDRLMCIIKKANETQTTLLSVDDVDRLSNSL
jgi:hypothetical protein